MTLKSALQDAKEKTLAAISGTLGKLSYLASLRSPDGRYQHWGLEAVHGLEASQRALKTVHEEVVTGILRTRICLLVEDLEQSSRESGVTAEVYVEGMLEHFENLVPGEDKGSPTATHLNSVLVALSSLENRAHSTHSTS
jgi:hypothetical protein